MAENPHHSPTDATITPPVTPPGANTPTPSQFQDQLAEEYTIETPENVSFGYAVAGIGSRFIAALIDSIILGILLTGLNIAIVVALVSIAESANAINDAPSSIDDSWAAGIVIAIYALLNFAIWWGYYLLFEWLWHGQTIGKRITHIRVVRTDGAPVSFLPVAVRNLVRIVDFMPGAYGVGVITMFCNRQSRRLGDFAAGTLVVKDQGELTLDALMANIPKAAAPQLRTELATPDTPLATTGEEDASDFAPDQDWSTIRRLTPADYALVQETLARYRSGSLDRALLSRVATVIATKLEQRPSSYVESINTTSTDRAKADAQIAFLDAVAAAYGRWVR